jgi:integrase
VLPALHDELASYRARLDPGPGELVFGTSTGARHSPTNIRLRLLAPAIEKANERLAKAKLEPLLEGLTPHSLRRTFASVLFAIGEPPQSVVGQLGHSDPTLTLRYYAREMSRRDGEPDRLKALVQGLDLVPTGTEAAEATSNGHGAEPAKPVNSGSKRP